MQNAKCKMQNGLSSGLTFCLLTSAICLLASMLSAASPTELVNQGNKAYEAADYARAIELYDSAAVRVGSADLCYNRGNAYFKLGQIGKAIADFSRAYVLNPYDPDIKYNLAFARAYRPDKTLVLQNPLVRFLTGFLRLFDFAFVRILAGALFLLAMAAAALLIVRGSRAWLWVTVSLGVICIYAFCSWFSWAAEASPERVVVIVPELVLRSGPGEDYKEMVIVHDGLECVVRDRRGKYVLLQAPGGQGGWAKVTTIEQIFPAR